MVTFSFFVVMEAWGPRFKGGGYMDQLHWSQNRRPWIGSRSVPYVVEDICTYRTIQPSRLLTCTDPGACLLYVNVTFTQIYQQNLNGTIDVQ